MIRPLAGVVAGVLAVGCSSSYMVPSGAGGTTGSAGDAGQLAGTTGSAGVGGTFAGAAGTTGSAGTGGGASVICTGSAIDNGSPGAIANPADFTINVDTGARDQHTLWMGRADMVRRVTQYRTAGSADHMHDVVFTEAQLDALLGGMTITVSTSGPPSNAATGHSHMITVRACGATPGFGGVTTGGGGSSG